MVDSKKWFAIKVGSLYVGTCLDRIVLALTKIGEHANMTI